MSNQISRRGFLRNAGLGVGSMVALAACQPMPAGSVDEDSGAAAGQAVEPVTITSMTWAWGDGSICRTERWRNQRRRTTSGMGRLLD